MLSVRSLVVRFSGYENDAGRFVGLVRCGGS